MVIRDGAVPEDRLDAMTRGIEVAAAADDPSIARGRIDLNDPGRAILGHEKHPIQVHRDGLQVTERRSGPIQRACVVAARKDGPVSALQVEDDESALLAGAAGLREAGPRKHAGGRSFQPHEIAHEVGPRPVPDDGSDAGGPEGCGAAAHDRPVAAGGSD